MSSLFSSLNVAVSGLNAQASAIGNISDNLANTETTGYKNISTSFSSLVTSSSSAANNPGGVSAAPRYENADQGNISSSSSETNLAISGDGFFVVTGSTTNTEGETEFFGTYYTRSGDFSEDAEGYLVNSSGYFLQGYTITDGIVDTSSISPIQISSLLDAPKATDTITYEANLPAGAVDYTSSSSTVDIYDSLGSTHGTEIVWETTATTNVWRATITVENGGGASNDYQAVFDVTFDTNGTISDITGVSSGYYDSTGTLVTSLGAVLTSGTGISGANANISLGATASDTGLLIFPGAGAQTMSFDLGSYLISAGVTQYSSSSSTVSVSSISQDGLGEGSYSSLNINSDGVVSINYTNGSTRKIYQVPIATFNASNNLQRESGGVYTATLASGTGNLRLAGNNGAGKISSSSLEDSTVDIATEFTTLIESQQVYSANAKIVTTVNSILTTIMQAVQ
ncbi:MAG: flagellar hook-basal body complex protein [Alphaproteobacteria bacterium]|nr:flagellar hook-basal body complex protein [Alphaproteobacteria bacterium]